MKSPTPQMSKTETNNGTKVKMQWVSIGSNKFAAGSTYVVFSSLKTSEEFLSKPAFKFNRLLLTNNSKFMIERLEKIERNQFLANNNCKKINIYYIYVVNRR